MRTHAGGGEAPPPYASSHGSAFTPSLRDPVHWLSKDLTARFGGRVVKAGLDTGGTCPNRDGTCGWGGCAWCDPGGSGPDDLRAAESWEVRLHRLARRAAETGRSGVIAYFQAHTASHAVSPKALERRLEAALAVPGVVGIALATRPDCLEEGHLGVLGRMGRRTFLWVELGMQTASDGTLAAMNRGHAHDATVRAVRALRDRGLPTVLHVILGLPGEGEAEFRRSLAEAARLRPWGLKIHPLHVVEGSALAGAWRRGELTLLDRERYAGLVADGLEILPPDVTVHRLAGGRPEGLLLAPGWCADKRRVLGAILSELARRGSWQGRRTGA